MLSIVTESEIHRLIDELYESDDDDDNSQEAHCFNKPKPMSVPWVIYWFYQRCRMVLCDWIQVGMFMSKLLLTGCSKAFKGGAVCCFLLTHFYFIVEVGFTFNIMIDTKYSNIYTLLLTIQRFFYALWEANCWKKSILLEWQRDRLHLGYTCHHLLSSPVVITRCHHPLSSPVVIARCHLPLSVITRCHRSLSSPVVITTLDLVSSLPPHCI